MGIEDILEGDDLEECINFRDEIAAIVKAKYGKQAPEIFDIARRTSDYMIKLCKEAGFPPDVMNDIGAVMNAVHAKAMKKTHDVMGDLGA